LKFFSVDSSVVLLHGIPFLFVGFFFASGIGHIIKAMEALGIWSLVLLVAVIALFFLVKHFIDKRTYAREAEQISAEQMVADPSNPNPMQPSITSLSMVPDSNETPYGGANPY
jgi:hypothetical protein